MPQAQRRTAYPKIPDVLSQVPAPALPAAPKPIDPLKEITELARLTHSINQLNADMAIARGPMIQGAADAKKVAAGAQLQARDPAPPTAPSDPGVQQMRQSAAQDKSHKSIFGKALGFLKDGIAETADVIGKANNAWYEHLIKAPAGAANEMFGVKGGTAVNIARGVGMIGVTAGGLMTLTGIGAPLGVPLIAGGVGLMTGGFAVEGAAIGARMAGGQSLSAAERDLRRLEETAAVPGWQKTFIQIATDPLWVLPNVGEVRGAAKAALLARAEGLSATEAFGRAMELGRSATARRTASLGAVQAGLGIGKDAGQVFRGGDLARLTVADMMARAGKPVNQEMLRGLTSLWAPFASQPAWLKLAYHVPDVLVPAEMADHLQAKATAATFKVLSGTLKLPFRGIAAGLRFSVGPGVAMRAAEAVDQTQAVLKDVLGANIVDSAPLIQHAPQLGAVDPLPDIARLKRITRIPRAVEDLRGWWRALGGRGSVHPRFINDLEVHLWDGAAGAYKAADPEAIGQIMANHGIRPDEGKLAEIARSMTSLGDRSNLRWQDLLTEPTASAASKLRGWAATAAREEGVAEDAAHWAQNFIGRTFNPYTHPALMAAWRRVTNPVWQSYRTFVVGRPTFVAHVFGENFLLALGKGAVGSLSARLLKPIGYGRNQAVAALERGGLPVTESALGQIDDRAYTLFTHGMPDIRQVPGMGPGSAAATEATSKLPLSDPLRWPWPIGRFGSPFQALAGRSREAARLVDKSATRGSEFVEFFARHGSLADIANSFLRAGSGVATTVRRYVAHDLYMNEARLFLSQNTDKLPHLYRALHSFESELPRGIPQATRDHLMVALIHGDQKLLSEVAGRTMTGVDAQPFLDTLAQADIPVQARDTLERVALDPEQWGTAGAEASRIIEREVAAAHTSPENFLRDVDGLVGVTAERSRQMAQGLSRAKTAEDKVRVIQTFIPDLLDGVRDSAVHSWDGVNGVYDQGAQRVRSGQIRISGRGEEAKGTFWYDYLAKPIQLEGKAADRAVNILPLIHGRLEGDALKPLELALGQLRMAGPEGEILANDVRVALDGYRQAMQAAGQAAKLPADSWQTFVAAADIVRAASPEQVDAVIESQLSRTLYRRKETLGQMLPNARELLTAARNIEPGRPLGGKDYYDLLWGPNMAEQRGRASEALRTAIDAHERAVKRASGWSLPIPPRPRVDESPVRYYASTLSDALEPQVVPGAKTVPPTLVGELRQTALGQAQAADAFWPTSEQAVELARRRIAIPRAHLEMTLGSEGAHRVLSAMQDTLAKLGHGAEVLPGGLATGAASDVLDMVWTGAMWQETGFGRLHPDLQYLGDAVGRIRQRFPLQGENVDALTEQAMSAVRGTSQADLRTHMQEHLQNLMERWGAMRAEQPSVGALNDTATAVGRARQLFSQLPGSELEFARDGLKTTVPQTARAIYNDTFINFDAQDHVDEFMGNFIPMWMFESRAFPALGNLMSRYPAMARLALTARIDHEAPESELPFFGLVLTPAGPSPIMSKFFALTQWRQHFGDNGDSSGPLGLAGDFIQNATRSGFYFHPGIQMALGAGKAALDIRQEKQARGQGFSVSDIARGIAEGGLSHFAATPYVQQFLEMPSIAAESVGIKGTDILQDPFYKRNIRLYIANQKDQNGRWLDPEGPLDDSQRAAWDQAYAKARRFAFRDVTLRTFAGFAKIRPQFWRDHIEVSKQIQDAAQKGMAIPEQVKRGMEPNFAGLRDVNLPLRDPHYAMYLKDTFAYKADQASWMASRLPELNTMSERFAKGEASTKEWTDAFYNFFKERKALRGDLQRRYKFALQDKATIDEFHNRFPRDDAPAKHPLDEMVNRWFDMFDKTNPLFLNDRGEYEQWRANVARHTFLSSLDQQQFGYLNERWNDVFPKETPIGQVARQFFEAQRMVGQIDATIPKYLGYTVDQARQVSVDREIYHGLLNSGFTNAVKAYLQSHPWVRSQSLHLNPEWAKAIAVNPMLIHFGLVSGIGPVDVEQALKTAEMQGLSQPTLEQILMMEEERLAEHVAGVPSSQIAGLEQVLGVPSN